VPYFNLFFGLDRPGSAAREFGTGGILRNTGLSFESDGLTGFPTIDARGHGTMGGAFGLNMLGSALDRQLVLEAAVTYPHSDDSPLPGEQFALGIRAQKPLTNAIIIRADAMQGWRAELGDVRGARLELRYKF
jgi:hypothetical protein